MTMEAIDATERVVLSARSVRNKIGVPVDRSLCSQEQLAALARLVKRGTLVWLDRAHIGIVCDSRLLFADIYLLTPSGVALCESEGIPQR